MERFILVDSNSLIHRAFHALPETLTDKKGNPTNAVFGFARIFLRALKDFKPTYVATTFDFPGKTFRDKLFPTYKATRPKTPEDLTSQFPQVKKLLEKMGLPIFEKEGFEADDLLASLKKKIRAQMPEAEIIILTGDNDTLQLVDEKTKVASPARGIQPPVLFDPEKIQEKYGLKPEQMLDFKALVGDPSDNVPGLRGIGPKTASDLLKKFKNLEGIFKAAKSASRRTPAGGIPPKLLDTLIDGEKHAFFNRQLLNLRADLPVELKPQSAKLGNYDAGALKNFITSLNMLTLLKDIPSSTPPAGGPSLFEK